PLDEVGMMSDIENALQALADRIRARPDWWMFPSEGLVKGFVGAGPVFLVGDQPSLSEWPESDPNRRVFYDTLAEVGLTNAHITDLVKRRGASSELHYRGLPPDFAEHLAFFREEVALLQPVRIIAMGRTTEKLIREHLPELRSQLRYVWHFAYVNRCAMSE